MLDVASHSGSLVPKVSFLVSLSPALTERPWEQGCHSKGGGGGEGEAELETFQIHNLTMYFFLVAFYFFYHGLFNVKFLVLHCYAHLAEWKRKKARIRNSYDRF